MIKPYKVRLINKRAILFISLFSFLGGFIISQNNLDSLQAVNLLEEAGDLADGKEYKKSNQKALQAAKKFKQLNDWEKWLDGYYQIFLNGYYTHDFSNTIQQLEKSLAELPADQSIIASRVNTYLGYAHDVVGDIYSSIAAYQASVPSLVLTKDTARLNKVYGNLGMAYKKLGDYSKAATFFDYAIASGRQLKDTTTLWKNLRLLGNAHRSNGDLKAAEKNYNDAQLLRDPKDGTFESVYATIKLDQNQFGEALLLIQEAIRLAKARYGDDLENYADYLEILGDIYLASRQPQHAIDQYQTILPVYGQVYGKRESGALYVKIGEGLEDLNQLEKALAISQKALKTFFPDFKKNDPATNPAENLWGREVWLMDIFRNKGRCFYKKYQSTKEEKWLFLAEEHFQLAIDFIQNNLTSNYDEIGSKLLIGEYTQPCYEFLVQTKLELFKISSDTRYQDEAFQVAQKANAFVLRELLNEQKALQVTGVAEDTLQLLKQRRQQVFLLQRQLGDDQGNTQDSLQQLLFKAKQDHLALKEAIEKNYPAFAKLRNDLDVPSVQQLKEALDSSSLLLKYFVGEKSIYTFSISSAGFHIETIELPADFQETVFHYRRSISDLDFIQDSTQLAEEQFLRSSQKLFELLLKKPLKKHNATPLNRLVIVADDILHTIPFQALQWTKAASWTDPDAFIISKYAVSYSYFCKLLLDNRLAPSPSYNFQSFGLEFDEYTLQYLHEIAKDSVKNKVLKERLRSGTFSNLPFSDDEAKELAQLMNGEPWLNDEATKGNFLKNALGASIIHIATHSILDDQNPNHSSLVFIKTKDTLDNLLRIEEIYNLRLNAGLIVLSACNTSFGEHQKGEGLNSLARAFNYAGVEGVTASLWGVSDEASKKIMLLYYENLKKGIRKDVAMQTAQMEYLQNDNISSPVFRRPVYWAAWMIIGDSDPVPVSDGNLSYYLILLGLALLGSWIFYKGMKYFRKK